MILIRADANERIGAGHVMRCLSIARAMAQRGKEVLFVTADHRGDALIAQAGFPRLCLDSHWDQMEEELPALMQCVNTLRPRLTLIDSYYVTQPYFSALSPLSPLAYLDDKNEALWDVDWLINYNIFAEEYDYSRYSQTRTKLLLQPRYAPLREEFAGFPAHAIRDRVTDVLVSAGGADPERITERIMDEICPCWEKVRFHFVVGALNPRLEEIRRRAGSNVVLHVNEQRMSALMRQCDLAISASGSTLYELCACGTPAITYTMADNQLPAAICFARNGMMLNAGDCRDNPRFSAALNRCLECLISNRAQRQAFSKQMQKLVDGLGADRIAETLEEGCVSP